MESSPHLNAIEPETQVVSRRLLIRMILLVFSLGAIVFDFLPVILADRKLAELKKQVETGAQQRAVTATLTRHGWTYSGHIHMPPDIVSSGHYDFIVVNLRDTPSIGYWIYAHGESLLERFSAGPSYARQEFMQRRLLPSAIVHFNPDGKVSSIDRLN